LDPITASRLDDLILQLRGSFGTTVVVVSHDLSSIFKIADRAVFLDIGQKTMTALGTPAELRRHPPTEEVRRFLTRNGEDGGAPPAPVLSFPAAANGPQKNVAMETLERARTP
jgi:ABC-type transporter Mla maintaining outer membrane lipid asymmetry ATPase subunit MlaF